MMGKVYSDSDSYLDNGIALLKAACEQNGLEMIVDDPADIEFMERFVTTDLPKQKERFGYTSKEIAIIMNNLAPDVFTPIVPASEKEDLIKRWDELQDIFNAITEEKMDKYLDELVNRAVNENVHIFGIKTWLGKRFIYSERLADKLSEVSPETFIIIGGPQVNNFHEEVLVNNKFDLAVFYEGEKTLVQLAEIIEEGKNKGLKKKEIMDIIIEEANRGNIPNLIYRNNGQIKKSVKELLPMAHKPFPKYDMSPCKVAIAVVEDELGCYYRKGCALCGHENAVGGYRKQTLDHLIEQIKQLIKQDVGLFRFSSSATSSATGYRIAKRILEERINLEFSEFTRAERKAKEIYWKLVQRYECMIPDFASMEIKNV